MKSYVILGGPTELIPTKLFQQIILERENNELIKVIGVDHGNIILLEHGIVPDVSVGDYDSLNNQERIQLESQVHDIRYANPEKDFTDSEFGINVALFDFKSDEIEVYGATGGRIDHFLVNLFSMMKPAFRGVSERIKLIDDQNIIEFFNPGSWTINQKSDYKYLAFVNLMAIKDFTIEDAKYPLDNFTVDYPVSWASNEFVRDTISFSFTAGFIAVIYSKDKK